MLARPLHSAPTASASLALAQTYLDAGRHHKAAENLDVAFILYDQAKVTFRQAADAYQVTPPLSQLKSALANAQTSQTPEEKALRERIAEVYFERAALLEKLGKTAKAQASYKKAHAWGYEETKPVAPMPVMSLFTSSAPAVTQMATSTSMPAQAKSDLVDYLFEKALLTLSSLKISNNPSLFLVYAHDNPIHGRADAETSKYLIDKLFQIQGFKLHSDQAPMGRPYSSSPEELKKDGKLGDIVTNQLCLLPAQLIKEVTPVDKVVVCSSEVLASYLEWKDYKKFHQELQDAYDKDLEAYRNNNEQNDAVAIRQVVNKFSQEEDYKAGFHHVLTEIAFLQIREKHMTGEHGIIPVSLTPNSYEECLAHFIPATTVRMEDIPRLEGQAQAGREVHQNQSRHGVLFKLIERLLVGSNEAKTFLDKFWTGHSECISLLNKNSTLGELGFAKLLDGIFDGIQRAQHSQLASILNQQDQELWVLKADPIDALKGQYLAALTHNEAFQETLKLYVEPRGQASINGESKIFELLPQVQAFLKDKKVILLTGDSGAGKTTFNRCLEKHLWDHKKVGDAIPLFISLPSIDKPEHDLIAKALKKRGLSELQIQKLKKENQRFVFILDGYDEIRQTQNLYVSNSINKPDGWQGHMVVSCRSEYLGQDYQSRFQPDPIKKDKDALFQEVVVEPFSEDESDQYLKKYVAHNPTGWTAQAYQEAFSKQPNLKDLISNPFLLRVVLEALPYVEKKGKAESAIQLRMNLYDQFVRQWFERNQQRLSAQSLTGNQKEVFRELYDDGFAQHGIGFVKELAVHLYKENAGNPIVEYSLFKDKGSWKDAFFGREEENQLLREAWPLIRSGAEYRFIHKSLLEYLVARSLFESFDACMDLSPRQRRGSDASVYSFETQSVPLSRQTLREVSLAPKHWVGDLGVVRLLAERVQQEPSFKKRLLAIIERSKTDAEVRQVAANAMTILVRAGVQFTGMDLQGIRIPGADLSYGVLGSAQLQGADLRKANLHTSWLREANLSGAQMAGVQFGEWPMLQENSEVISCAYSPDGKTCAMGLVNGAIRVYDTSSWEKIHTLQGHDKSVNSVAYSPNGEQIASASDDKTVRLWDAHSGALRHTLQGHKRLVKSVMYSPNGEQIASGSSDKTVRLWDTQSGALHHALRGHSSSVLSVAYSPNGEQIASGSDDNTVRLWDAGIGALRYTLRGHGSSVLSVAYSPNGEQIASGSYDKTVRLWNAQNGALRHTLQGHDSSVLSVAYSPNSEQIASGSSDTSVRLWDARIGALRHTLQGHYSPVLSVAYSPNGEQIASGSEDKTVRLWDAGIGALRYTLQGHDSSVLSVAYSPNGEQIASGSFDNTVRLWDAGIGVLRYTLQGHDRPINSVAYSPNGEQLASGSDDNTVRLWDTRIGALHHTLQGHDKSVLSVAYSPNGEQIASGSDDKTVRLWDARIGALRHALQGHDSPVVSVAYSPNGEQIASGSYDKTVRLWDAGIGALRHTLQGHENIVRSVAYSPNGEEIASGSDDKTVRLWDVKIGALRYTLQGHDKSVLSVAYSPNGEQIASGSEDDTVRLWEVASGQCRAVIQGFSWKVYSVAWKATPEEGNDLVTGSGDKFVRQWRVIAKGESYQVVLRWVSPHAELAVKDMLIEGVEGLSRMNEQLLRQRGAIEERR